MAGSAKDAGEEVPCPSCGATVLRKQMIPVLAEGGDRRAAYVCVQCARAHVTAQPPSPAGGSEEGGEGAL